jgi:3-isopropylmalate dehydrogenase
MVITRGTTERLSRFSFDMARRRASRRGRPGCVTLVDKANVFRAFAFMRRVFDEVATDYPDVSAKHHYIDAMALDLVRHPWRFDVMPTENQFGDILSDLGAGLVGGMGFAPSADIGDCHGLFQPCHGSAPDIAGRGIANPTAMILSTAMMLEWLDDRLDRPALGEAARDIQRAVDITYGSGVVKSVDIGGRSGTREVASAIVDTFLGL